MLPESSLSSPTMAVGHCHGSSADVVVPYGTPPLSPMCEAATTAISVATTTHSQPHPVISSDAASDLPQPLSDGWRDGIPYHQVEPPILPETSSVYNITHTIEATSRACCSTADTPQLLPDTHNLLSNSVPHFTICNIPHGSSSTTTPAFTYSIAAGQQMLPTGSPVCPRYTGIFALDDILHGEGSWVSHGRVEAPDDPRRSYTSAPVGGVGVVRRWACTGALLLVGALPWIIAMATFIRQRNSALAGLLGLVFVFFMAVVLGRIIRRVQEAGWLARQERRRRQCMTHCSSQMLMSESPPAYEVVVKSPPPYSISCVSSSHSQSSHADSSYVTPMTHLHDRTHRDQSTETLAGTRITNIDDRDPSLPSYDEAIRHCKTSD
ncbi:unnamed protein product, partial [Meganyctiphanes norvegica]